MTKTYEAPAVVSSNEIVAATNALIGGGGDTGKQQRPVGSVGFGL